MALKILGVAQKYSLGRPVQISVSVPYNNKLLRALVLHFFGSIQHIQFAATLVSVLFVNKAMSCSLTYWVLYDMPGWRKMNGMLALELKS